MAELEVCPECSVPIYLTTENIWLDNGDVVQARAQANRLALIECENLDPLFEGIGQIIGLPIEPIVVEAVRRNMRRYLRQFVTDEMRDRIMAGELDPTEVDKAFMATAILTGYGRYEVVESRFERDGDDFHTVKVSEPFSVPMCAGSHCAAMEAILGYDHAVTYAQLDEQTYEIKAYPSPQPRAFVDRLHTQRYRPRPGDLELERCPTCGGPKALSVCAWYLSRGIIVNKPLKRRMALVGPAELDPIFAELEDELGEMIPQIVVEAQRRFSKTGFYTMQEVENEGDFRIQLALRGLGNLRELKINKRGLHLLVENAALPMIIVGMMQGIFEMAFDMETDLEWEMSRGNLRVELTPKDVSVSV
jgi:hypothetical protein